MPSAAVVAALIVLAACGSDPEPSAEAPDFEELQDGWEAGQDDGDAISLELATEDGVEVFHEIQGYYEPATGPRTGVATIEAREVEPYGSVNALVLTWDNDNAYSPKVNVFVEFTGELMRLSSYVGIGDEPLYFNRQGD